MSAKGTLLYYCWVRAALSSPNDQGQLFLLGDDTFPCLLMSWQSEPEVSRR